MPVTLPREAWSAWLGETAASADELQAVLKPYPSSARVVADPSCQSGSIKDFQFQATARGEHKRKNPPARRLAGCPKVRGSD
jgi:putative SOS response-associated peptidase YedK